MMRWGSLWGLQERLPSSGAISGEVGSSPKELRAEEVAASRHVPSLLSRTGRLWGFRTEACSRNRLRVWLDLVG